MFPPIEYVEWIRPRIEAATHDLGSSDLHPEATPDSVVPPRLKDVDTPEASLEALVARTYGVLPERVLITAGASAANLLTTATALALDAADRSDGETGRVMVEKPGYEAHTATPKGFAAVVDRFMRPQDRDWALDPDRIRNAVMPETALVTVSNKHNPSGAVTPRETLAACATAASSEGAWFHVDEVYGPYGGDVEEAGFGGDSVAGLANTVVTGSTTKFWGLGSLRIGWLVGPEAFVERAEQMAVHLSDVAGPSRTLARRALSVRDHLDAEASARCRQNHDLLAEFVADHPDLTGRVYDGCSFAFVSHADEAVDGDELAAAAWEEGVLVVPGRFFGAPAGVRIALGHPPDRCATALSALDRALTRL